LEATSPAAKEFVEWRYLAKHAALSPTANATSLLVLFGDDYVFCGIHVFVAAVVELRVREICAWRFNGSVDNR
jgi:hypothetical protein